MANKKQTSKSVATKASQILRDDRYSKKSKSVAGSALSQTKTKRKQFQGGSTAILPSYFSSSNKNAISKSEKKAFQIANISVRVKSDRLCTLSEKVSGLIPRCAASFLPVICRFHISDFKFISMFLSPPYTAVKRCYYRFFLPLYSKSGIYKIWGQCLRRVQHIRKINSRKIRNFGTVGTTNRRNEGVFFVSPACCMFSCNEVTKK